MKILIVILLCGALGAGGWYYSRRPAHGGADAQASAKVDTAVIETRNIKFSINAAGDITPAEQVSVRPEVNGKIEVLPVDVGDRVKAGQLLFKLDDRELQTQRQHEEKNVERSRLQLGQAERDYQRARQLFEGKLISQELFEDSRTKYDLAKNELALREKSLDLIVERLRKTEVMAPFDSTILTRPISVGQAVSGSGGFNAGTEVLTIANLNDLIVNAHINQADVTRLHVDQQVEVTVEAVSGLKVMGKVERIAPQSTLKNNIRGFAARILLKDVGNQIRPGMSANISIPVASADNVVAAPLAAVFTETNPATREIERHVWVRKDESWERRSVKIGVTDYFFAEVTSGLQAGEVVSLEDRSKEMSTGGATNGVKVASQSAGRPR